MTGIYLEWLKLKKLSHLYEQQCITKQTNQHKDILYQHNMLFYKQYIIDWLRRITCFRRKGAKIYQKFRLARNQYSFFLIFWFSDRCKQKCFRRESTKISARSQSFMGFLASFWFLVWFQTPKYRTFRLARSQYSLFMSFWFSGRYNVSDAKVHKFRLARSAHSQPLMGYSRVSGKFLVGINRHEQDHITSVTNIRTHCTDRLYDSPTGVNPGGWGMYPPPPPPLVWVGGWPVQTSPPLFEDKITLNLTFIVKKLTFKTVKIARSLRSLAHKCILRLDLCGFASTCILFLTSCTYIKKGVEWSKHYVTLWLGKV